MRLLYSIILFSFLFTLITTTCPSACNCTNKNDSCPVCLSTYFRQLTVNYACVCIANYSQLKVASDYCCPNNCLKCYSKGCAICITGYKTVYNSINLANECICANYYYYNGTTCVCLSVQSPSSYYNDNSNNCYKCPTGCICNASGCVSCPSSTFRSNILSNGIYICSCTDPLIEKSDGTCGTYANCTFTFDNPKNITINCSNSIYITSRNGVYGCVPFLTLSAQYCYCNGNSYKINFTADNYCACSSISDYTRYYYYNSVCYSCPQGCTCNIYGCTSCTAATNRLIYQNSCFCKTNYYQFNGLCICAYPYFFNTTTYTCDCLSINNSVSYFFDYDTSSCNECPVGCSCSKVGCYSCISSANRNVTLNSQSNYICLCNNHSTYSTSTQDCQCNYKYTLIDSVCKCLSNNDPTLYYNDVDLDLCNVCPSGCTCSSLGCVTCASYANRTIKSNSENIKTCYCTIPFVQLNGICTCVYLFNTITGSCTCQLPYYTDSSGNCVCSSITTPSSYYIDINTCYFCPYGCKCNSSGCAFCGNNTLRQIVISTSNYYTCPCISTAVLVGGYCTKCYFNQYYSNGICIPCSGCLTCNQLGCLSCTSDATLDTVNHVCKCTNTNFIIMNGICQCASGYYQNNSQCSQCPVYCKQCRYINSVIQCISCNSNVYRQDNSASNCSCMTNYIQAVPRQTFCCHSSCQSCTISGCTSCYPFTNTTIASVSGYNQCTCLTSFISNPNNYFCICPIGKYYYNSYCYPCPNNCLTCALNYTNSTSNITCLTCPSNMNRNTTSNTCQCLSQFLQASPIQTYCYPQYCQTLTMICQKCTKNRTVTNNGTKCGCGLGFYINAYNECSLCNITGCISCSNSSICTICDNSDNFYLINNNCEKVSPLSSIVFSQYSEGITVYVSIQNVTSNFNNTYSLRQVNIKIINIISTSISTPIPINVTQFINFSINTFYAQIQNPSFQLTDILMQLILSLQVNSTYLTYYHTYIQVNQIYSNSQISHWKQNVYILQNILVLILMLLSYIIYLNKFRHHCNIYYIQTFAFLAYSILDQGWEMTSFLFNLKYSYFYFTQSDIMFRTVSPKYYIQASSGNFSYLTKDSNILRITSACILLLILTLIVKIIFQTIKYLFKQRYKNKIEAHKTKIQVSIQFMHKLLMYPLVFFSINTLINWNIIVISIGTNFNLGCKLLSIIILIYYSVYYFIYYLSEVPIMKKILNINEYLVQIATSIVIIYTLNNKYALLIILIFILRLSVLLLIQYRYADEKQFKLRNGFKISSCISEIIALILAITNYSYIGCVILFSAGLLLEIIYESISVWKNHKKEFFKMKAEENRLKKNQFEETDSIENLKFI